VGCRLQEAGDQIAKKYGRGKLGPGMELLSILDREETCSLLRDGLKHAMALREALRDAMREDPEGMSIAMLHLRFSVAFSSACKLIPRIGWNWYPELLSELTT
jgi:hypothetical protein